MTTVLLIAPAGAPPLTDDLTAAGLTVLGSTDARHLVATALRLVPDVVVAWTQHGDEALFLAAETLASTAPLPLLVFTADARVESLQRALAAGIHAWVVQGYQPQRLRPLVQLAQARCAHERGLREALSDLGQRFEERKLIDRAKGILMRAQQLSEDEAFRALRSASQQGNRRVGQVSQQVIEAARGADAINRAGQLRMLSQRVLKLRALGAAGVDAGGAQALLVASLSRAELNLAALDALLSRPTFGDLLDALRAAWTALAAALTGAASVTALPAADALAEEALVRADRLVAALEADGSGATLHVINLCGRQRMLAQRLAKQALLGGLLDGEAAAAATEGARRTAAEFERAMTALRGLPLITAEIRGGLDSAAQTWDALLAGQRQAQQPQGRRALAGASEALLELFERLTDRYESSMQVLIGPGREAPHGRR